LKDEHSYLLFFLVYGVACAAMLMLDGSFLYGMLFWNALLASVPLYFMKQLMKNRENHQRLKRALSFLLWMAFFPNSIYMVTDFIHISNDAMIWSVPTEPYSGLNSIRYSMDMLQWGKLLVISLGAVYALLAGFSSLNELYEYILEKSGWKRAMVLVVGISLISSFGVYIGRFLRFNSWDLLKPAVLIPQIMDSLNIFTVQFTMIYAVFVLTVFWLLRWMSFRKI